MQKDDKGHPPEITIIVNGRKKVVNDDTLTFEQVIKLAFDPPPYGENTLFTVTYRKGGNPRKSEGTLVAGDNVKIKNGSIFDVSATNRS